MDSKQLYHKGLDFAKQGEYDRALQAFNEAISMDNANAEIFSDRGVTKFHLKDLEGALADMNASVKLDPENAYRYASRAYIRERMGDVEGALEDYKTALKLDPENAVTHNNLGMLEEKMGYIKRAIKHYKVADTLDDVLNTETTTQQEKDVVQELLRELQIEVQREPKPQKISLTGQMFSVFRSKEAFRDYVKFVRKIFRK